DSFARETGIRLSFGHGPTPQQHSLFKPHDLDLEASMRFQCHVCCWANSRKVHHHQGWTPRREPGSPHPRGSLASLAAALASFTPLAFLTAFAAFALLTLLFLLLARNAGIPKGLSQGY